MNPVLVTASDTRAVGYPLLSVLLGRWRRQRVVVNILSGRFAEDASAWSPARKAFRRLTLRLANGVLVCNRELARAVIKLGVPQQRLYRAGCFLAQPGPERDEEQQLPVRDFLAAHSPVVLAVGSLRSLYQLPLAVRAVGRLAEACPSIGLILVTSGCVEDSERDAVQAAIEQVGRERVSLLHEVGHTSLLGLMDCCDVYLRLTTHDGDSVSLREALARGLRCVATDTGNRPAGVTVVGDSTPDAVGRAVREALCRPVPSRSRVNREAEHNMEHIVGALCGGRG